MWKDLGKDAFGRWREYVKDSRNPNELMLCCRMLGRLLAESYRYVEEIEGEKHKKSAPLRTERKAKLKCIKSLSDKHELYGSGSGSDLDSSSHENMRDAEGEEEKKQDEPMAIV